MSTGRPQISVPARIWFLAVLAVTLAAPSPAQIAETTAVAFVQNLAASRLDSTLPAGRFVDWVTEVAGRDARMEWELNDCGEQTGDPEVDRERDIPACVAVIVSLPDGRSFGITLMVGTDKTGLLQEPGVYDIFVASGDAYRTVRRLRDLRAALASP